MAAEGSTGPIVASKKMLKEYVTPHKIALLVLIKEYCVIKVKGTTTPIALYLPNDEVDC